MDSAGRPKALIRDEKSPLMYIAMLMLYGLCALRLNPRLLKLFDEPTTIGQSLLIVTFIAALNVFWFFGAYYTVLGVFTLIVSRRRHVRPTPVRTGPTVAVLYLTMNDFQRTAALSTLNQDYEQSHLYILDDSVDPRWRAKVDEFALEHQGGVTVIRRANRLGYKAGSINSALRSQVGAVEFFVVADADSVLPPDFVSRLVPYFTDDQIGWIQASHAPNPEQKTAFAADLALGILPLWEVYYSPRNRYGNVIFLGHGGMIRHRVWEEIGGFPEIVSEDLAFSTRAAQFGYRGYYAADVVSFEDFPAGYRQLRRQQAKYVSGACEYLHRESWSFLRSNRVSWFEKLDVLMSCGSLLMQPFVLAFMLVFCVAIPSAFGAWRPVTVHLYAHDLFSFPVRLLGERFADVWSADFYVVTAMCTLAPVLGCFSIIARYPRAGTRMFLMSAVPYLSLLVMSTVSIVSYVFSRRAVFLVTGDQLGVDPQSFPTGFSPASPLVERIGAEDRTTHGLEVALGIVLTITCVATFNVSLLAFALALALGPVLLHVRWEAPMLRPVLYLPYLLVFIGLWLGQLNVLSSSGAAIGAFFFHF